MAYFGLDPTAPSFPGGLVVGDNKADQRAPTRLKEVVQVSGWEFMCGWVIYNSCVCVCVWNGDRSMGPSVRGVVGSVEVHVYTHQTNQKNTKKNRACSSP